MTSEYIDSPGNAGSPGTPESTEPPEMAADLFAAIRLAEEAFSAIDAVPGDYRLVAAEQMLAGGEHCGSPRCWRLTFKLARLIPTKLPARLAAGGELFFTVDLEEEKAVFTGYGE